MGPCGASPDGFAAIEMPTWLCAGQPPATCMGRNPFEGSGFRDLWVLAAALGRQKERVVQGNARPRYSVEFVWVLTGRQWCLLKSRANIDCFIAVLFWSVVCSWMPLVASAIAAARLLIF